MPGRGDAPPGGLPWAGRPTRADLLCWSGITLSGLYSLALIPLRPVLLGRDPVLLELLTGSMTSIVTASAFARVGEVPLPLAILAAVPGMIMFDPFFWWAGRRWGRGPLAVFTGRRRRGGRVIARAERLSHRFGPFAVALAYFLPVPAVLVFTAAGWAGMRLVTFVLLDALGALLWIGMLAGLGYFLGQNAVDVARAVSRYGLWAALPLCTAVIALRWWRTRPAAAPEPAHEPPHETAGRDR